MMDKSDFERRPPAATPAREPGQSTRFRNRLTETDLSVVL